MKNLFQYRSVPVCGTNRCDERDISHLNDTSHSHHGATDFGRNGDVLGRSASLTGSTRVDR